MSFKHFENVQNELNDHKPVKVGRDGQPLSWRCGVRVLEIYENICSADTSGDRQMGESIDAVRRSLSGIKT